MWFINDKEAFAKYYDPEQMTLNHWKMPGMIRKTKKAFLSFCSPEMLALIQNMDKNIPSYSAIRHGCNRKGIPCSLHLCRKVFASWLHESNIPDITIDMLSGRCPKSVLAQHYVVPNSSLRDRVLDAVAALSSHILSGKRELAN